MAIKTALGALRYNNRMNRIWEKCKDLERERLNNGEGANPNLTDISMLPKCNVCDVYVTSMEYHMRKHENKLCKECKKNISEIESVYCIECTKEYQESWNKTLSPLYE